MGEFLLLDRRIPQSDAYVSLEDFDAYSGKKAPLNLALIIDLIDDLKSPELCSLVFRRCRKWLTVLALHRHSLLAEDQITGVQAIPSTGETL